MTDTQWSEYGDKHDMGNELHTKSWWNRLHWVWKLAFLSIAIRLVIYIIRAFAG